MSPPLCCPHCSADIWSISGRCWLCHKPLPPGLVPPRTLSVYDFVSPPAPTVETRKDSRTTNIALIAGVLTVALGAVGVSAGLAVTIVALLLLPCWWSVKEILTPPPAVPYSRAELKAAAPVKPPSRKRDLLEVLGIAAAAVILVPFAMMLALYVTCAGILIFMGAVGR